MALAMCTIPGNVITPKVFPYAGQAPERTGKQFLRAVVNAKHLFEAEDCPDPTANFDHYAAQVKLAVRTRLQTCYPAMLVPEAGDMPDESDGGIHLSLSKTLGLPGRKERLHPRMILVNVGIYRRGDQVYARHQVCVGALPSSMAFLFARQNVPLSGKPAQGKSLEAATCRVEEHLRRARPPLEAAAMHTLAALAAFTAPRPESASPPPIGA